MWELVIALLLSGCGSSASRVETLKSWSFQYNEGTSDYSLFFGLADKNDKPLSADVDVDIRIVNDADEEVYTGRKSVSTDDFSYYTSQVAGEQYLANVRIPAAEIKAGTSASGKVYFTVYKENIPRNSDGSSVIISTEQGRVRIKDSRKSGTEVLMDADQFLDMITRW